MGGKRLSGKRKAHKPKVVRSRHRHPFRWLWSKWNAILPTLALVLSLLQDGPIALKHLPVTVQNKPSNPSFNGNAARYDFDIAVTDSLGQQARQSDSITVISPPPDKQNPPVEKPLRGVLAANTSSPYSWSISAGTLPPGMSMGKVY